MDQPREDPAGLVPWEQRTRFAPQTPYWPLGKPPPRPPLPGRLIGAAVVLFVLPALTMAGAALSVFVGMLMILGMQNPGDLMTPLVRVVINACLTSIPVDVTLGVLLLQRQLWVRPVVLALSAAWFVFALVILASGHRGGVWHVLLAVFLGAPIILTALLARPLPPL